MNRRDFLLAASSAIVSPWALARPTKGPVDVVKIMSLACPVCRAAENQDPFIAKAARAAGGTFVWAPVPTEEDDLHGAAERTYYASRAFGEDFAAKVKDSLYRGWQDMGVPLYNVPQVFSWLGQDLAPEINTLTKLQDAVVRGAGQRALTRAATLAVNAGVQVLPGYVLLQRGQILVLLDPSVVQGQSLLLLRQKVISYL